MHGLGLLEDGRPDVFGEVGRDGCDEEDGDADPPSDEFPVHADIGGDLAVPVTSGLQFVEPIL